MPIINISGTSTSTIDGIGLSYNIFFQGCPHKCNNCHNPDLQEIGSGQDIELDDLLDYFITKSNFYDSLVLTGGDPIFQLKSIQPKALYTSFNKLTKPTILYTGYLFEDIPSWLLNIFTVIIDGKYKPELATHGFPASSNQRVFLNYNKPLNRKSYNFISKLPENNTYQYSYIIPSEQY